jgi:hypothetical protein
MVQHVLCKAPRTLLEAIVTSDGYVKQLTWLFQHRCAFTPDTYTAHHHMQNDNLARTAVRGVGQRMHEAH